MKAYLSTTEVAQEFQVSDQTVRTWIEDRKLMAFRPSGPGGRYRIPAAALEVFRRQATPRRDDPRPEPIILPMDMMTLEDFYRERIEPVVNETGRSAEDLIRMMAQDASLVIRYPSFASDYTAYVSGLSTAAAQGVSAHHAGA